MRLSIVDPADNRWYFLIATDEDSGIWAWQAFSLDRTDVKNHMRYAYDSVRAKLKEKLQKQVHLLDCMRWNRQLERQRTPFKCVCEQVRAERMTTSEI